jgi:hypothetical protein
MVFNITASHEGTSYSLYNPAFYSSIGSKYLPSQGPLSNVTVYANMVTEFELFYTETVPKTFGVLDVGASFYGPIPREKPSYKLLAPYGKVFS